MAATATPSGPRLLDALSLLSEVTDQLVVRSVRDTHLAWADRAHGVRRRGIGGTASLPETMHRGIAGAVYAGLGAGLKGAAFGFDRLAATGIGPGLEDGRRGRFVSSAVNGLIGDRLLRERPQLAIPMAARVDGRDVDIDGGGLAAAYPEATGRLVVFLHGLCENESYWNLHRDRTGTTYGEALAGRGWTPVFLRANTGLPLRENGVALAALMQRLVDEWPVPVTRIALVGHSLGGLVMRAAGAVAAEAPASGTDWNALVGDVITLGTPHLGAPIAWGIGHGSRGLGKVPETAAIGRILDWRSVGVHDLVAGLADDVPPLPHARYHLVCATVTRARAPPGRRPGRRFPGSSAVGVRAGPPGRPPLPRRRRDARGPHRPLRPAQPSRYPPGNGRLAGVTADREPDRELRAEATVDAPPEQVWDLLTDLDRMPEWSPELLRMLPLKRGGLRKGQWYLGINRRKAVVWPTRSVVAVLEPGRTLAWDTKTSGARWIWELAPAGESTQVVHRRPVPAKLTPLSKVFAGGFLGGGPEHADELEEGMALTVARLKAAAEAD